MGYYDSSRRQVINLELVIVHALLQNSVQHLCLFGRDDFASPVHFSHIAEEPRFQRAVAQHYAFHCLETAGHIPAQLVFGVAWLCHYGMQAFEKFVCLTLYDGVENITFALEIRVNGTSAFVRSGRYIVHRRILNAFAGKELARYFYEFLACFTYHRRCVNCTLAAILSKISNNFLFANHVGSKIWIIFAFMEQTYDRDGLESLLFDEARRINNAEFIASDPVQFPRRYSALPDIEIASLLVSTISWGNRRMICRDSARLLDMMDSSPLLWCREEAYELLDDDVNIHRTFFGRHLKHYMRGLKWIYDRYPSIDAFAMSQGVGASEAPSYCLAELLNGVLFQANGGKSDSRCLPLNLRTTALKRLNMALRWLVRDDGIVDMGVWKSIKPSQLFIPLDVHSADTSRRLGLITRRSTDRRALDELMAGVRPFNPDDPAVFDFALFGIGMGL